MSALGWTGTEPLALGTTTLLEASAGTGKTWQIEALVVRLVAEYGVPIERVLVITFTNVATAELRERIRQRLAMARSALEGATEAPKDPIFAYLWHDESQRSARLMNVARALSAFDLAPISTIHAFSQHMLEQLAFESGLESGLELLANVKPLLRELVDDELARVYDEADELDLGVLEDMGWERGELIALASLMIKAVAPRVSPEPESTALAATPLVLARRWRERAEALLAWLEGPEGRGCAAALEAERTRGGKGTKKRAVGKYLGLIKQHDDLGSLLDWLKDGALHSACLHSNVRAGWLKRLTFEELRSNWTDSSSVADSFEAAPLFHRVSELVASQDALWPQAAACFAHRIRSRVQAELQRRGVLTYDTMLSLLADRIAAQGEHGPLASAIRKRFDVALVDEFQDTDAAQWPVLRAVFAHPERRLLIIGDPKQAIYAFRGADVHVYLDAKRVAQQHATMTSNRRSDGAYVSAMNHVFAAGSGVFALEGIDYVQVDAHHQAQRIRGLPAIEGRARRAFELRWFDGTTLGQELSVQLTDKPESLNKGQSGELTPRLCAIEIARLLTAGVELLEEPKDGGVAHWRPLAPGDIAVLSRTNHQGERMRKHLAELRIPAVSAARGSVLKSPVVRWLCAFLDALAEPGRDGPARALAVTPLFGWTGTELVDALELRDRAADAASEAAEPRWNAWMAEVTRWANRYAKQGFIRVLEAALDTHGALLRLLALEDGERYATDLRHLTELCHAEERRTRLGPAALAAWLRASASVETSEDEAEALRLESDARAVQLVTIHKSKGLEYPVVMLPFVWDSKEPREKGEPVVWHSEVGDSWQATLDLHPKGVTERVEALAKHSEAQAQEDLRLLYVALTRARHHCVAWLGAVVSGRLPKDGSKSETKSVRSALLRVACRPRDASGALTGEPAQQSDGYASLARLADASTDTVGVACERLPERVDRLTLEPATAAELNARPFTGPASLGSRFQVTSYSTLVKGRTADLDEPTRKDDAALRSTDADPAFAIGDQGIEAEDMGPDLELDDPNLSAVAGDPALATPAPLAPMLGGKEIGTWVHEVFEQLDFAQGSSNEGQTALELATSLGERHGIRALEQHALLVGGLPAILDTPLGGAQTMLPPGFCLRQLMRADRLDELSFDLRLGAGTEYRSASVGAGRCIDEAAARLALAARLAAEPSWVGKPWLEELLARTDPRDGTLKPVLPAIAGILTGAIDLIFRVGESPDTARYYIADYKTNRIAPKDARRDSLLVHYTQPWLHVEMARHGYPLQALLYTIALHRLLGQRLGAAYDYDRHVGGCLYLFLRGMQGPSCHRDGGLALGVLHDRWPKHVVLGLDAALCGDDAESVRRILDQARVAGAVR